MMKSNKLITIGIVLGLAVLVMALGVGFSSLEAPRSATLSTVREAWVDDDDPACGGNQPCFSTIQAAVDALTDVLGKIHIRSGTYRENVILNKLVQIIGAGRDLVRIEPRDPKKPTIFVLSYVEAREIGIYGRDQGDTGIEVAGSRGVIRIQQSRIMNSGILLHASSNERGNIIQNEINNTSVQIEGSVFFAQNVLSHSRLLVTFSDTSLARIRSSIIGNTFVASDISLRGRPIQNDFVTIAYNRFVGDYYNIGIFLGDEASAFIEGNQISGYGVGIQTNSKSQAIIRLNSLMNNRVGFQSGLGFYVNGGVAEWMKRGWSPRFELTRNQIVNNIVGLLLVEGQGQIMRNQIAHNGLSDDFWTYELWKGKRGGLFLSPWVKVELSHNYFLNNTYGAAYTSNPLEAECQRAPLDGGEIKGSENEFRNNEFADLCPADYPWPPGFRK
ncbi:hypothetical protein LM602_05315 [Candidatus Acetothermia bacterium]|jgi:hypothetical protein|nr:hypothetical protein [Candidatus Acetothermia bacterium]MCI2431962.1 hypothetical protein [Candidatus Acetothermia bacterium]MCI2436725.1 hypothetical protein [Candidatus Acetothermia bacterium]